MIKTLLLALSLLGSAAWLSAQSQYPQTGSNQTGTAASTQTTVRGCLQGADGNYTLMADNGTTYRLEGDTSKLTEHVGHEVKITGSSMSESATNNPTSTASGTQQPTLTVESFKHISKTCTSAGKSNK
jgi:hypothetical protein